MDLVGFLYEAIFMAVAMQEAGSVLTSFSVFLQLFADRAVVPSMGLANSQVTAGK